MAHVQPWSGELGSVEDVRRLAVLEHHVCGRVDHVADGPHAGSAQAPLHPVRARTDLDSADRNGDEARAQVRHLDGDVDQLGSRRWHAFDERRHEIGLEVTSRRGAQLARDPEVTQAVRGRDVLAERLTWLATVEQHDPRLAAFPEEKLVRRAQHSLCRLPCDLSIAHQSSAGHARARQRDRHEGALHRVRRAGDDLDHLSTADVDLVDPQRLVRARVVLLLEDAADDDRAQVDHLDRLDLRAGHREQLRCVLRSQTARIHVLAKPLVGDAHLLEVSTFTAPKSR